MTQIHILRRPPQPHARIHGRRPIRLVATQRRSLPTHYPLHQRLHQRSRNRAQRPGFRRFTRDEGHLQLAHHFRFTVIRHHDRDERRQRPNSHVQRVAGLGIGIQQRSQAFQRRALCIAIHGPMRQPSQDDVIVNPWVVQQRDTYVFTSTFPQTNGESA
jgi:hypothetical protein